MTNELTIRDDQSLAQRHSQVTEVQRLGALLAASGYFSDAREMAQAAVKVMAGEELGIPPVAAMMGINIIKGKVALSGNLIASRIRAHGYDYRHKQFDARGCILEFLGKPDTAGKRPFLGESSFTEEDAKAAQCFSDMYKKYPRNMYFNRAISNGAKWYTPEVFAGAPVYVAEELGAKVDENGDMIHEDAPSSQAVAERKIVELKAGKAYTDISEPDPRVEPAKPRTSAAPTAEELRHIPGCDPALRKDEPQEAPATPTTLDQVLATFGKLDRIAAAYAQLKIHFLKTLDQAYWDDICLEYKCDGVKQFPSIGAAKKCFSALWRALEKASQLPDDDAEGFTGGPVPESSEVR